MIKFKNSETHVRAQVELLGQIGGYSLRFQDAPNARAGLLPVLLAFVAVASDFCLLSARAFEKFDCLKQTGGLSKFVGKS